MRARRKRVLHIVEPPYGCEVAGLSDDLSSPKALFGVHEPPFTIPGEKGRPCPRNGLLPSLSSGVGSMVVVARSGLRAAGSLFRVKGYPDGQSLCRRRSQRD